MSGMWGLPFGYDHMRLWTRHATALHTEAALSLFMPIMPFFLFFESVGTGKRALLRRPLILRSPFQSGAKSAPNSPKCLGATGLPGARCMPWKVSGKTEGLGLGWEPACHWYQETGDSSLGLAPPAGQALQLSTCLCLLFFLLTEAEHMF